MNLERGPVYPKSFRMFQPFFPAGRSTPHRQSMSREAAISLLKVSPDNSLSVSSQTENLKIVVGKSVLTVLPVNCCASAGGAWLPFLRACTGYWNHVSVRKSHPSQLRRGNVRLNRDGKVKRLMSSSVIVAEKMRPNDPIGGFLGRLLTCCGALSYIIPTSLRGTSTAKRGDFGEFID